MNDWWLAAAFHQSPVFAIAWVCWVIISITLHELGHGWMAIRCGDDTPIITGHMTLNPLVHIPRTAWFMFLLFGFTWGLMPVNRALLRGRHDDALVSFAGPAMNLVQAFILLMATVLFLRFGSGFSQEIIHNVWLVLHIGVAINLVGFVFNLLPVPPLDGSWILMDFFPQVRTAFQGEAGKFVLIGLGLLLMFKGGDVIWPLAFNGTNWCEAAGLRLLGVPVP